MRVVNTQLLGWIDLDHILRITPVEWEINTKGEGGYYVSYVYMMMRDEPFRVSSEWINHNVNSRPECPQEFHDAFKHLLTSWART